MPRGARGTLAHRAAPLPIGPRGAVGWIGSAPAALLTHADRDLDGRALEAELLTEPTLDEAAVARLDEARREDHEAGRARRGLGREEDARLLSAPQRGGGRGNDLPEERGETSGRDAGGPRLEGRLHPRHEPVHVAAGAGRDVGSGGPGHLHELLLDLALEVVAALLVDLVPLVVCDDQRAPRVDDLLHDPDVLLGDGLLGVDEDDSHLSLL